MVKQFIFFISTYLTKNNFILIEATKNDEFGCKQYEENMKEGFKLAKNRMYKNNYQLKQLKNK